MIESYLLQFGESIGVANLQFGPKDCLSFDVERSGVVYIERAEEEIFFYVLKDFNTLQLPYVYYQEALSMMAHQESYAFVVHAIAKKADRIGFFLRLPERQCDLPMINRVFTFLLNLVHSLEEKAQAAVKEAGRINVIN